MIYVLYIMYINTNMIIMYITYIVQYSILLYIIYTCVLCGRVWAVSCRLPSPRCVLQGTVQDQGGHGYMPLRLLVLWLCLLMRQVPMSDSVVAADGTAYVSE
jgi:hypothetical protein